MIFEYTLHIPCESVAGKMGNVILRRAAHGQSILTWLMKSLEILKVTSSVLSDVVTTHNIRMPKNSSKNAKIRKLMSLPIVKEALTADELACLENKMKQQEENRQKKKTSEEKDEDGSENEDLTEERP